MIIQYFHSRADAAVEETSQFQGHKTLKHGLPGVDKVRFFEDFVVAFDTRTKNPEWVLERISSTDKPKIGDRCSICTFKTRLQEMN